MLGQEILRTISNLIIAYLEQLNKVKNSDKEKYVYRGYGITFNNAGSWDFDNTLLEMLQFLVLVIVHHDNRKNNFLILGEGPTYGINGSFGSPEKKFSINFT